MLSLSSFSLFEYFLGEFTISVFSKLSNLEETVYNAVVSVFVGVLVFIIIIIIFFVGFLIDIINAIYIYYVLFVLPTI